MTVFGYARVSTKQQSLQSQRIALSQAGASVIVEEKVSGVAAARPLFEELMQTLDEGDTLVVTRLDRLGRSMQHLVATVESLAGRGVVVRSLHESIDTGSANGKLLLSMFAALAQFERDLIAERTKAGLAAAKSAGKQLGRPRALSIEQQTAARDLRSQGYSYAAIARTLEVAKSTVLNTLKQ